MLGPVNRFLAVQRKTASFSVRSPYCFLSHLVRRSKKRFKIRETLAFHQEGKEFGGFVLQARGSRDVKELEAGKSPEQSPTGAQMSDVPVEISVFGINVGEGDHRYVLGCGVGNTQGGEVGKRDAFTFCCGGENRLSSTLKRSMKYRRFSSAVS